MQRSRVEKRMDFYSFLKENGQTRTMEHLYPSEVKKLQDNGYTVSQLVKHPVRKSLWYCEVIFPQVEPQSD